MICKLHAQASPGIFGCEETFWGCVTHPSHGTSSGSDPCGDGLLGTGHANHGAKAAQGVLGDAGR